MHVEPVLRSPLVERQENVGRVAVIDHVAPWQRKAALDGPDARKLPAADDPGNYRIGISQQGPALAEGQRPDAAEINTVRRIEVRDFPNWSGVGRIQQVDGLLPFRERV